MDRIEKILKASGGRARIQDVLDKLKEKEANPELPYSSVYIAVQSENKRLQELGEPIKFDTSRGTEERGWISLPQALPGEDGVVENLKERIVEINRNLDEQLTEWLSGMEWQEFEDSFLEQVLNQLGFQDIQITQRTRDGGVDAVVKFKRALVHATAIVSAKHWAAGGRSVSVDEVRRLRGVPISADTAIIITTSRFSDEAIKEAGLEGGWKSVYLIDGQQIVDICKRSKLGVRVEPLPELLVMDLESIGRPALGADSAPRQTIRDRRSTPTRQNFTKSDSTDVDPGGKRLRDEMLGDAERGLSTDEVARLSGYSQNTVRAYLTDPAKRKVLGRAIRSHPESRRAAIQIISERRSN